MERYKADIEKGLELLVLCSQLQTEKDGVNRPAPNEFDKSKTLDQFAMDISNSMVWMSSLYKFYPMSAKLSELGRKLEADGKIRVRIGDEYSQAALEYLCREHGISDKDK